MNILLPLHIQLEIKIYTILAKTGSSPIKVENTKLEIIKHGLFKKLKLINMTV